VQIPDSDVQFDPQTGNAEMRVTNLQEIDTFNLLHSLGPVGTTVFVPATVSFDIVWSGPVTRQVNVDHGTNGNLFSGRYSEDHVSMTWSATNSAGFSFQANRGDFSTSVPGTPFAEVGFEQNGQFAQGGPAGGSAAPQPPGQQTPSADQAQPAAQQSTTPWLLSWPAPGPTGNYSTPPTLLDPPPSSPSQASQDIVTPLPTESQAPTPSAAISDQAFASLGANSPDQPSLGDSLGG
jgi:hypothetical protein